MSSSVLVVIGSGPGIGLSTASIFASRKFSKIALISRDSSRLAKDKASVISVAKAAGQDVEFLIFSQDIAETVSFQKTLVQIKEMGEILCITNIGLLTTARWGMPLLTKSTDKPSLLVTNSLLWQDPYPPFFALSMVKSSQRNLVQTLKAMYPDVHVALVNVAGIVSPEDPVFDPKAIGERFWEVYEQERGVWTLEENIVAP